MYKNCSIFYWVKSLILSQKIEHINKKIRKNKKSIFFEKWRNIYLKTTFFWYTMGKV